MTLGLIPSETPTDQPGVDKGYGRDPVGQTKEDCKKKAQEEGGVAWDEHAQACWLLFGKAVIIGPDIHSIEEFAEVVNFNFRTQGNMPAVPDQFALPGPSDGLGGDGGSVVNPYMEHYV